LDPPHKDQSNGKGNGYKQNKFEPSLTANNSNNVRREIIKLMKSLENNSISSETTDFEHIISIKIFDNLKRRKSNQSLPTCV
jgi:hypothetical protein